MSFYSSLPTNRNDLPSLLYPTIFEIIASEEIDTLLPSSIRYIITNYWVLKNPNWYTLQVNNFFEEWFELGFKGFLEWYHLKHFNSTFVDKFYGLQKFNSKNKTLLNAQVYSNFSDNWPIGLQLTQKQKRIVFLQNIILPYIGDKLDELFNKINSVVNTSKVKTTIDHLKSLFVKIYPIVTKCFYILNLLFKLSFLTGKIGSFSLLDYMYDISYTRAILPLESRPNVAYINSTSNDRLKRQNTYSSLRYFQKNIQTLSKILSYSGSQVFPTFLFMLRVYQWWTTQDITVKIKRKLNNLDKDIPKPPVTETKQSSNICPICEDIIQNPCILETGYVACYPCVLDYLPQHEGKCPVTKKTLLGCQYDEKTDEWRIVNGVRRLLI